MKTECPDEYRQFEVGLDKILLDTYHRLRDEDAPKLGLPSLSINEKMILLCQPSTRDFKDWEVHKKNGVIQEKNLKVFDFFRKNHYALANDIWNRTGILVLIQRQKIIEKITGKKFALPPNFSGTVRKKQEEASEEYAERKRAYEEQWFSELMSDKEFRMYYDAIPWESPLAEKLFQEIQTEIIRKTRK